MTRKAVSRKCLSVGVLSGTSADGIDTALVEWNGVRPAVRHAITVPYSKSTKAMIGRFRNLSTEEVARLHRVVGDEFAAAVLKLIRRSSVSRQKISVIGSHGQTLFHLPRVMSLQVGSPAVIAERTGIPVAADFRSEDIAAGGEGAPLVPILDEVLLSRFRRRPGRLAALNIGGIANITVMQHGKIERAFDIGPGNCLMDLTAAKFLKKSRDESGRSAGQGRVDAKMLEKLLAHSFFSKSPPKSTGVEEFGVDFLKGSFPRLPRNREAVNDRLALLTETTAVLISREINARKISEVWVSGGGIHNTHLMKRIARLAPLCRIQNASELGIDPDYKEAVLFSLLARYRIEEKRIDLRRVTGSSRRKVLGGLWLP